MTLPGHRDMLLTFRQEIEVKLKYLRRIILWGQRSLGRLSSGEGRGSDKPTDPSTPLEGQPSLKLTSN